MVYPVMTRLYVLFRKPKLTLDLLTLSFNLLLFYPDVYQFFIKSTCNFIFCQKHALDRKCVSCYIYFEFFSTKFRDF